MAIQGMTKILFIGDIVGRGGRRALREVLPQWKQKYKPDVTIVNVENIAHGKGVTVNTLVNIDDLGIDAYTTGNHAFDKKELSSAAFEKYENLIRPANYESLGEEKSAVPGHGYYRFSKNGQHYLILNFNGTVFFEKQFPGEISNPFIAVDSLLTEQKQNGDIIIVDLHAEATSEKVSFGYHCDGRVTAVLGTHTHIPTADARVLPGGTAYITDVGMTGARDSVLGVKKENALVKFLDPNQRFKYDIDEEGLMMINGVIIEADETGKAIEIQKLYQEI
jgi:metallophosphoesterase (TIGR00282 family)